MLDKNEIAEFFPLIASFVVAGFLILFTQPQSVISNQQSPVIDYLNLHQDPP